MKTEIVGTWDGDYKATVALLCCKSREMRIRMQGKKLVIKDTRIEFYICIPLGEPIEIPVYETNDDEDEPIILEEPLSEVQKQSLSAQQEQMMREWGLL